MEKLLALAVLVLASLACGQYTVGTIQTLPTVQPTVTNTPLPTVTEKVLATPTATPMSEMVFIYGSHNLRAEPKGSGVSYGHVSNEWVILIPTDKETDWIKIQVGIYTGWVSPLAVE